MTGFRPQDGGDERSDNRSISVVPGPDGDAPPRSSEWPLVTNGQVFKAVRLARANDNPKPMGRVLIWLIAVTAIAGGIGLAAFLII